MVGKMPEHHNVVLCSNDFCEVPEASVPGKLDMYQNLHFQSKDLIPIIQKNLAANLKHFEQLSQENLQVKAVWIYLDLKYCGMIE